MRGVRNHDFSTSEIPPCHRVSGSEGIQDRAVPPCFGLNITTFRPLKSRRAPVFRLHNGSKITICQPLKSCCPTVLRLQNGSKITTFRPLKSCRATVFRLQDRSRIMASRPLKSRRASAFRLQKGLKLTTFDRQIELMLPERRTLGRALFGIAGISLELYLFHFASVLNFPPNSPTIYGPKM